MSLKPQSLPCEIPALYWGSNPCEGLEHHHNTSIIIYYSFFPNSLFTALEKDRPANLLDGICSVLQSTVLCLEPEGQFVALENI